MILGSEKALERKLCSEVKKLGGWAIKLLPFQVAGLPDRMVLLPQGKMFFVEMKSNGAKPSPIQKVIHKHLEALGFPVYVIDTTDKLNNFISEVC